MSLQIKNLTKVYGPQQALKGVSFELRAGEIVGFLGPNGAGKSTTMKIATCFIPPTAGTVTVGGHDVVDDPMGVKRITGYLPEHNPLYLDLFVHEYLRFAGKLYGLAGKQLTRRVSEMVAVCGLTLEQNKRIEALSRGYRQRVGLAQALLHDPQVLILDEPTSGLDPNQLVEVRKLIKDISRQKTVIFSTHIMQEVEALCDRVIVINKGQIVADDTLSNLLRKTSGGQILVIEFEREIAIENLAIIPGVLGVQHEGQGTYRLRASPTTDIRPALFRMAADKHLALVGLRQEESSLESVFHDLTGAAPVEH
ncbi:MAG TPA: gliding motility-associated ABC transporter ATP-binding subunit GldA [Ohtaekwangia sp.]|nr:gliding motility-associated ABC transporter ATP-binding subunit GldA [Ohtaekwangia sp.]